MKHQYKKALDRAFKLLAIKDRSVLEMKKKLKEKDFPINIIEEVIVYLIDNAYLNDYKVAQKIIEERIKKKTGKNKVKSYLYSKGFSTSLIEETIEIYTTEREFSNAQYLVERKIHSNNNDDSFDEKLIVRLLKNRGFTAETIVKVIDINKT